MQTAQQTIARPAPTLANIPLNPSLSQSGYPYLHFAINENTQAVIPAVAAQEVVIVPRQQITAMPHMAPSVLGLLNRRSRISWVLDLATLLELPTPETPALDYTVILVRVAVGEGLYSAANLLGIVVQQVKGNLRLTPDLVQSPLQQYPSGLTPYLSGCVQQDQSMVLVLSVDAIARSNALLLNS
jgi:twitching motility protein PilI